MSARNTVGRATAAAVLAVASSGAQASTQTLNISLNQLLTGGASYSGAFDISSLLGHYDNLAHHVTGATITAFGYSDAQFTYTGDTSDGINYTGGYGYFVQTGGGYYVSQTCGSWLNHYECGYYVNPYGFTAFVSYANSLSTSNYVDQTIDKMTLTSGEGSASGADINQATAYGNYNYAGSDSSGSYYSQLYTTYYNRSAQSGSFGSLLAQTVLNSADLHAANLNGLIDFAVTDTTGQFRLQNVTLSIEVDAVPEPTTWAMMVAGFGAAGLGMRRARQKKAMAAKA